MTQWTKSELTFTIFTEAEMPTGQQKHAHFIHSASLARHDLFHVIVLLAKQVKINGTAIAARSCIIYFTVATSLFTVSALHIHLLEIELESCDHVFIVSGSLLPSTRFNSQLFHSLFKLHILPVNDLHLRLFLAEFLKDLFFNK
jgi:hypothetical protein